MWLTDYYQQVDPIFFVISILVGLGVLSLIVAIIFTNIMHLILTPRLDPILFNERWFTLTELGMYSVWPMSLVKSGTYMGLIGFPKRMLKTKRFKGYDLDLSFSQPLIIASRMCVFTILSVVFFGISFGLVILYGIIKTEFF